MNRPTIRLIVGVIALAVAGFAAMQRKGNAGNEALHMAQAVVSKVEGYSTAKDYYDNLVEQAHDEVFSDSYHSDYSRYRGDHSWVDGDKYLEDLFAAMIRLANQDNAPHVAAALTKYRDENMRNGATENAPPKKPARRAR